MFVDRARIGHYVEQDPLGRNGGAHRFTGPGGGGGVACEESGLKIWLGSRFGDEEFLTGGCYREFRELGMGSDSQLPCPLPSAG